MWRFFGEQSPLCFVLESRSVGATLRHSTLCNKRVEPCAASVSIYCAFPGLRGAAVDGEGSLSPHQFQNICIGEVVAAEHEKVESGIKLKAQWGAGSGTSMVFALIRIGNAASHATGLSGGNPHCSFPLSISEQNRLPRSALSDGDIGAPGWRGEKRHKTYLLNQ